MSKRALILAVVIWLVAIVGPLGTAAAGAETSTSSAARAAANRPDPHCRVRLTPGRESHAINFATSCNFEQRRIMIRPDRNVFGLEHSAEVSRGEPSDHFRCHRRRGPSP